ncbi:hypothetical protein Tco_0725233 [Tanacetum coccineum]|uniref:Uncharacterized protein n=1 Tax=Tanacetum coccineum TaxID=301880 RepID=A0ABQ4YEE8_9ASTR
MFIKSKIYFNDEYIVMARNYFLQYTQRDIPEFRETLVQFMEYVKKSIDERELHKRKHDSRVNERQTQTTMEKVDTSKELDDSSVIIKSNGTKSQEQDTSSRSGNDAHVDDVDIRPIYDEEPKAEERLSRMLKNDTCPLPAKLTDDKTIELSNQLLESENACSFMLCDLDFEPLSLSLLSMPSCDLVSLANIFILCLILKDSNQSLRKQQSQFLKEKGNEAKVNNDIDEIEIIKIELEHSVAKLLAKNELTQSLVAEKTDILENRASRNFDLMINIMTFVHISSGLASFFIVMTSVHISSGLVLHQMTSDHNRSELGIQDHSNEQSSSKLVPKVVP